MSETISLDKLLSMELDGENQKIGMSEERLKENLSGVRDAIAFWREYPDIFVDFLCGDNPENFELKYYQRVYLRAVLRHRNSYFTYPRGYSKSFLAVLGMALRCILYPNSELFVTSGVKTQGASILKEKMELLCHLIPGLKYEIDWRKGKTITGKDEATYLFKNGSKLRTLAAQQSSRGQRTTGGIVEECAQIDGDILNEVVIPTMAINRQLPGGGSVESEPVNKSQVYITTAGFKNTFAYAKLREMAVYQVLYPEQYIVMGGDWKIPVYEGLQSRNFIEDLKLSGVYNEASFDREYMSSWTGDIENAFFSSELFDKHRILRQPEKEASGRSNKNSYYIIGVDVGRTSDQTEIVVFKVTPQVEGTSIKTLVNLWSLNRAHLEEQAIEIKKAFFRYKAKKVVIDGNGVGLGLLDEMVKSQVDPATGDILPDFGIENDTDGLYKAYRTPITKVDAIYSIKANAPINTEAHSYTQAQLSSGKIKFLIDENQAKIKLKETKMGQMMTPEQQAEYLKPFTYTTILREQMSNLIEKNEGVNIILDRQNKAMKKDKFSAMEYALYYIKLEEQRNKKRGRRDLSKMMLYS